MKSNEGYIEVEYRIAVILNESGLIRNTYSNVVPNLSSLMSSEKKKFQRFKKKYVFVPFTRNNLSELLSDKGINSMESFDAIFISTNATNDNQVLNNLIYNKSIIEAFIKRGKGLFMGSQKKLSEKEGPVSFLPESLTFKYITRPEEKSSEGRIHIKNGKDCLVLNCDEENINHKCHNNRFKDHVYRSYMRPQYLDMFVNVLVDQKYDSRKLLIRAKQSKVVYSTISLDYEEQNDLLKNIILFITEGVSSIVFFADTTKQGFSFSKKYNNLLLNAQLNKLPISIYKNLEVNDEIKSKKIFVISSDYSITETREFWEKVQEDSHNSNNNLKKLIYLNESSATESIITEYRNYSEVDVKLKKVILWVQSKIREKNEKKEKLQKNEHKKVWEINFWATYDTMSFIFELYKTYGMEYLLMIQSYGLPFLEASVNHYRELGKEEQGSYDGMLNCSCALLELFVLFDLDNLQSTNKTKIAILNQYNVELTINYIVEYIKNDTSYIDSEMVLLSLLNLKRYEIDNPAILRLISDKSFMDSLLKKVIEYRILVEYNFVLNDGRYVLIRENYRTRDLQELCKDIEVMAYALTNDDVICDEVKIKLEKIIIQHLLQIKILQTNGYWTNFNRTSAILKILMQVAYYNDLLSYPNEILNSILSQIIMSALNYILKEIENENPDDESRMWMKDLEATVTLSYALCLYNRYNRNDASKIEMSIIDGANDISNIDALDNSAKELNLMRFEKDKILDNNYQLSQKLDASVKETEKNIKKLLLERNSFKNRRRILIIILIAFAVIAIEEAIVIANNNLFSDLMIWFYSLLGTIVAFGVSLLLKNLLESKLFPSDEKLFKIKKTKKEKQKNEKQ